MCTCASSVKVQHYNVKVAFVTLRWFLVIWAVHATIAWSNDSASFQQVFYWLTHGTHPHIAQNGDDQSSFC